MNNKLNEFSKDNLVSLIDALISEYFRLVRERNKQASNNLLEKIQIIDLSKSKEALLKQRVFQVLIEHVKIDEEITYGELTREINERFGMNIPERGNSMGRIIGNVLGSLSIISFFSADVLISVYVKNKSTNKPGKGLKKLESILVNEVYNNNEISEEDIDLNLEKAKVLYLFSELNKDNLWFQKKNITEL